MLTESILVEPLSEPGGTYSEDGILLTASSYSDGIISGALGTPTPSFYFDGQNGGPPPGFNAYAQFSLVDGASFTLDSLDLKTNGFESKYMETSAMTGLVVIGDPLTLTTIPFLVLRTLTKTQKNSRRNWIISRLLLSLNRGR
jgi:hypothetical protein